MSQKWTKQALQTKQKREISKADIEEHGGTILPKQARTDDGTDTTSQNMTAANPGFARGGGGIRQQWQRPTAPLPTATALHIKDFFVRDAKQLPLNVFKGKNSSTITRSLPLRSPNGGPVLLKLTGGGSISPPIGVSKSEFGWTVNMTVDTEQEAKNLDRLYSECEAWATSVATGYYPDDRIDYSNLMGRQYSVSKPKGKGSKEFWPRLLSMKLKEQDLISKDSRLEPELIITTDDDKIITNFMDLHGMRWSSLTYEWSGFLLGYAREDEKENTPSVPHISITRRLRRMRVSIDETLSHLVFPMHQQEHDSTECKRKHHRVTSIKDFRMTSPDVLLHDLTTKGQATTGRIEWQDGTDVYLEFVGGGSIPPFFIDLDREGKHVATVSIDDPEEEHACDELKKDFIQCIVKRRTSYFPKSADEEGFLHRFCKGILGKKSDKVGNEHYSRSISAKVDLKKLGSMIRIVDSRGIDIENPEDIIGKKWDRMWIAIRCTYMQVKGDGIWEVGLTKRLVYLSIAPDMASYQLVEEPNVPKPTA